MDWILHLAQGVPATAKKSVETFVVRKWRNLVAKNRNCAQQHALCYPTTLVFSKIERRQQHMHRATEV